MGFRSRGVLDEQYSRPSPRASFAPPEIPRYSFTGLYRVQP
jgi:hypothetical protein